MPTRETGQSTVQLAILGCGAVTEIYHLPAAQRIREAEIVALVDNNITRARTLGKRFGIRWCTENYQQLPDNVNGVIVALPNYLHAPATIEFLERGIPVLVEKPMALTVEEAEVMVKAADANGVALQVGLMFRFCDGACLMKRAVDEGWLGRLQSFSLESGFVYDWPVTSGFFSNRGQSGGGQLMDIGSHLLDLLLWWIGDVVDVDYKDDSLGGVEADCWLTLRLQAATGPVQGTVELSRLRKLRNTARIVGEQFTIEYDLTSPYSTSSATVRMWPSLWDGKNILFVSDFGPLAGQPQNVYAKQLQAFAQTILTGCEPAVPGKQVIQSMVLIEKCYRERKPLEFPWMRLPPQRESV
jgi:predicted dehydrogenase